MDAAPVSPQGRIIGRIESAEWLDGPAYAIANAVALPQRLAGRPGRRVRNALHGVSFGHPLHPLVVTLPIGAWTLAAGLDALETAGLSADGMGRAADLAVTAGVIGAFGAAMTGAVDWQQSHGAPRRVGLVHAFANTVALGLQLGSLRLRSRGRRREARLASAVAWSFMLAGGYLGGHMVYRLRQGVDQSDRNLVPRRFQSVLPVAELQEGRPHRVEVWDRDERAEVPVVLVRQRGKIHALGARCSHMGGPLDEGWLLEGALVCPWHGSRYDLETGSPIDGPSTCPQPRYAVRVREGSIQIARLQDPGSDAVTPRELARSEAEEIARGGSSPRGPKAQDVLFEHHQLLRGMFRRLEAMSPEDPARRDLMRTLATELDIHETIEDGIFYPAVRPVSEDVPVAYAEHQELADLMATTLKLPTSSAAFDEHLRALHQAVDHHASAEERSMFKEAQRLGDRRLRELGHALELKLEEERTARFHKAFRELKLSLLENVGRAGR